MSLQIGIVGLPNVGKSTLFNALTRQSVPAQNYPFCTIDPSVGVVAVRDERLEKLALFTGSKKTIPAAVEFVDIAGLVRGASSGEGLGNKFLSNIRETDAILQVVRIFEDDKQIHVHGGVDPLFDIEVINMELIQADLETIDKRIAGVGRDARRGDKDALAKEAALQKAKAILESGQLVSLGGLTDEEKLLIRDAHLITAKPILFALNKKSGGKNLDEMKDERFIKLVEYIQKSGAGYCIIDAKIEDDLKDFEGDERSMFASELGHDGNDGITELIASGYKLLGLESYFTTGPEETRSWTIKKGSTAPIAGTAIHTDFKDKFIRAEVVFWSDLLDAGSYAEARAKGLVRTEGKEYIVKDGDVIEFKV